MGILQKPLDLGMYFHALGKQRHSHSLFGDIAGLCSGSDSEGVFGVHDGFAAGILDCGGRIGGNTRIVHRAVEQVSAVRTGQFQSAPRRRFQPVFQRRDSGIEI